MFGENVIMTTVSLNCPILYQTYERNLYIHSYTFSSVEDRQFDSQPEDNRYEYIYPYFSYSGTHKLVWSAGQS